MSNCAKAAVLAALISNVAAGQAVASSAPSLKCDVGPIVKTFGGTQWLVYSCEDHRTLAVSASASSPAGPFYFILYPADDKYKIYGEGTGNKAFSDKAGDDLARLKSDQIQVLIAETRRKPAP